MSSSILLLARRRNCRSSASTIGLAAPPEFILSQIQTRFTSNQPNGYLARSEQTPPRTWLAHGLQCRDKSSPDFFSPADFSASNTCISAYVAGWPKTIYRRRRYGNQTEEEGKGEREWSLSAAKMSLEVAGDRKGSAFFVVDGEDRVRGRRVDEINGVRKGGSTCFYFYSFYTSTPTVGDSSAFKSHILWNMYTQKELDVNSRVTVLLFLVSLPSN